jgi:hypothetical protein
MEASVSTGIPFVLVFLGRSGFCGFERAWCPAKLDSGSQIFQAFKVDIYDSVYEHVNFPQWKRTYGGSMAVQWPLIGTRRDVGGCVNE